MRPPVSCALLPLALLASSPVMAQASNTASQNFSVIGTVPALCSVGTPDNSGGVFNMGVLVDTTTGLLRTDLSAPDKKLTGAFCSARSTIAVNALPMQAQSFTGTPPSGFASAVNYTATASGWTTTAASFQTASSSNPAATQTRSSAFTGDITVGVSAFATAGGASLRPVADNQYLGQVTVTLTAAN